LVGTRICGGVSPDKDADHPSGTTVSQILDFDAGQVLSFVTYTAAGTRQATLDRGAITLEDGQV
jgi:hypothetical protein